MEALNDKIRRTINAVLNFTFKFTWVFNTFMAVEIAFNDSTYSNVVRTMMHENAHSSCILALFYRNGII
jgi:hypothetical protein